MSASARSASSWSGAAAIHRPSARSSIPCGKPGFVITCKPPMIISYSSWECRGRNMSSARLRRTRPGQKSSSPTSARPLRLFRWKLPLWPLAEEPLDQEPSHKQEWKPAAATLEIWGGEDAALAQLLQDCLRENGIGVRCEGKPPGIIHLRVMPSDEAAGREIVREVREASPPV